MRGLVGAGAGPSTQLTLLSHPTFGEHISHAWSSWLVAQQHCGPRTSYQKPSRNIGSLCGWDLDVRDTLRS